MPRYIAKIEDLNFELLGIFVVVLLLCFCMGVAKAYLIRKYFCHRASNWS